MKESAIVELPTARPPLVTSDTFVPSTVIGGAPDVRVRDLIITAEFEGSNKSGCVHIVAIGPTIWDASCGIPSVEQPISTKPPVPRETSVPSMVSSGSKTSVCVPTVASGECIVTGSPSDNGRLYDPEDMVDIAIGSFPVFYGSGVPTECTDSAVDVATGVLFVVYPAFNTADEKPLQLQSTAHARADR
ncbi:uncharacterized protein BDZ99DRAFT_521390 [Mytilinidion resinicola]|uniref:Uncharacterized protein n=1 Tax=Mytilinidion resinicola TaxID=574789 RepID=A0A6A6YK28_9PEZI|nr:uncharacterized protein BDZ99DRAFT_521390 [Mytilinidion resinicola]KAF2808918.1 hypothetical protein BDZ99DRAFT_521390 [Mytilinidion resinicola]